MVKFVELRRHTDNEADLLSDEGISAAMEIGSRLEGPYDLLISSGAQRATQTLACFLAAMGQKVAGGVTVDPSFRSEQEQRWFDAASRAGGKDLNAFKQIDEELVSSEAVRFTDAVKRVIDRLPDGGRALVVGHSPMHECAVLGLTGEVVDPIAKGMAVLILSDGEKVSVEKLEK